MPKTRWIAVILLSVGALGPPLRAEVTLSDAVRRAFERSPGLGRSLLGEEEAKVELEAARRQRFFRLDGGASYRFNTDSVSVKAADFPVLPPDLGIPETHVLLSSPKDFYDLNLSLVQPIFSGGALRQAVRMGEIRELIEKHRTELERIELEGLVRSSFLTYVSLRAKRASLSRHLESLGLHLQKIEALVREDLARRSDALETRLKIDEARLGLEDLRQHLETERIAFSSLCGLDPEDVRADGAVSFGSFEECWRIFLERHPILKAFDEQRRLIEAGRKAAAASRLPQVGMVYELHYGRPGQNFFRDKWKLYVQAGLSLSLPLVNRLESDRDLALAELEGRKLDYRKKQFLLEVETSLKQLFELKRTLAEKLTCAESLIRNAEEDARLKSRLYGEGQISNLDYLAAETAAERYRSLREEIEAQIHLADVRLQTLVGLTGEGQ